MTNISETIARGDVTRNFQLIDKSWIMWS